MIAIILMLIVFLSFATIISYSVLTMNQNVIVTGELEASKNEMTMIKNILISNAKPIISSDDYALPYGTDDPTNNEHLLPSDIGVSLVNNSGFNYLYCPYGIVDTTTKSEIVSQNSGANYSVNNTLINGVNYTTHSEVAHSISGAPEVLAYIISKNQDVDIDCSSISYDSNSQTFYSRNASVEYITKTEVQQYYRLNDLSGVTEEITVDDSTFEEVFQLIENDQSNKAYEISLASNLVFDSGNNDFNFSREKNKRTKFTIYSNDFLLRNVGSFTVNNIDLHYKGTDSSTVTATTMPQIVANFSNVYLENAIIGGIELNNSKLEIIDSQLYSSTTNSSLLGKNSIINSYGTNILYSNKSTMEEKTIHLKNSEMSILSGIFSLSLLNKEPNYNIYLENAKFSLFDGDFSIISASKTSLEDEFVIDSGSSLYLNNANITLYGDSSNTSGVSLLVKGVLSSGGTSTSSINMSNANKIETMIRIDGGSMKLENINIGDNGNRAIDYTIREKIHPSVGSGIDYIWGDSSVSVYGDAGKCWDGTTFTNEDTTVTDTTSSSDRMNNGSAWLCVQ